MSVWALSRRHGRFLPGTLICWPSHLARQPCELVRFESLEEEWEEKVALGDVVPMETLPGGPLQNRDVGGKWTVELEHLPDHMLPATTPSLDGEPATSPLEGGGGDGLCDHVRSSLEKSNRLFLASVDDLDDDDEDLPLAKVKKATRPRRKIAPVRDLKTILRRSSLSKPDVDVAAKKPKKRKRKAPPRQTEKKKPVPMMNPFVVLRRVDLPDNWLPSNVSKDGDAVLFQSLTTRLGLKKCSIT